MTTTAETFARLHEYDLAKVETALTAVVDARKWGRIEDERFREYVSRGRHGNSVRAAERAHNRRNARAIDLVWLARGVDPRIDEAKYDVEHDDCLRALTAVRDELHAKIEALRRSLP